MWVLTPRGFYSAVEKFGDKADGMITVRARAKADLDRLADLLPEGVEPYAEKGYSDYPWRIRLKHEVWDEVVTKLSQEIDYSNFKDAVKHVNPDRASVYGQVWGTLLRIEQEDPVARKRYSGSGSYGTGGTSAYGAWDDDPLNDPPGDLPDLPGADGSGYGGSPSASRSLTRSQTKLFPDLDSGLRNRGTSGSARSGGKRKGGSPKRKQEKG